PDPTALQALLAEMRAAGTTHVALEVSSHALAQERVAGCRFDAAVFTNLTRDHLDFHGDLERYGAAKARLFLDELPASGKRDPVAVVNVDDPAGARPAARGRPRGGRGRRRAGGAGRPPPAAPALAGARARPPARAPLARGRLITVFGCGGDRDRGKRPLMGEAAARRSDVVVLTSDNPRTEDPLCILADIEEGVRAAGMTGHVVEPDRRAAIALALGL